MKRTSAFGVFVVALAVVFVTASGPGAFAQDPKGGGGGGGQGGGGGAAPRGGGGGGDTGGARGGGGMSSAPAPSSPGGSSGGSSGGSVWGGGGMSGGGSGSMAVPRGAGRTNAAGGERQPGVAGPRGNGGGGVIREGRPSDGSAYGRSRTDDQMSERVRPGSGTSGVESSVPWYSRPRGSNPVTGTAVPRTDAPVTNPPIGGGGYYPGYPGYYPGYPGYGGYWNGYYDCAYYPYGCGNPWGYGAFGLGYFYFNPFAWNYGDYANWGGGGGGGSYSGQPMGSIRLKVKPNTASVYVDGYYAGTVDSFDNAFQKLAVGLGSHRIEISEPGYQPLVFEINVEDFETIVYEGRLEPIR